MNKNNLIYDGKAKSILAIDGNPDQVIQFFKDSITAFNNPQPYFFEGKGVVSCEISSEIFKFLGENGITTHLISQNAEDSQIVQKVSVLPIEVTMRNYAFGNGLKRMHFQKGEKLAIPLIEFMYKRDDLGDPLISECYVLNYLLEGNIDLFMNVKNMTYRINNLLIKFFDSIDIVLGDFKLEFGINKNGELLLADEISGDTCRLLDKRNNLAPLDKDILRQNLGNVLDGYKEVLRRIKERA
jgi:phosphoribosylaminoimidazole-succinocarboxamide synthase